MKLKIIGKTLLTDSNFNCIIGNEYDAENSDISYLGDGYYRIRENKNKASNIVIVKNNEKEKVYSFYASDSSMGVCDYKDNVIYYNTKIDKKDYIIAYDLVNKKELWKTEGRTAVVTEYGYIWVYIYNGNLYKILDKSGKIIAEDNEDVKVYRTETKYYFKVKEDDKVEVYDDKQKISELSLKSEKQNMSIRFKWALSNGMFVIQEDYYGGNEKDVYKVYNKDLNIVTEFNHNLYDSDNDSFQPLTRSNASRSIIFHVTTEDPSDIIIYSDGTVEKIHSGTIGLLSSTPKHYLIGWNNGVRLINLDNKKAKNLNNETGDSGDIVGESPNGKYVIVEYRNSAKNYYVFDENLDNIYESDNELRVVNDKYVIEYNRKNSEEIFLVNVFTKEKKKIEINGEYYGNNLLGIITKKDSKYCLYSFK